ncbi:MAG: sugar transferase [Rhodospirillales bacterium]|nr:sugar transferase [Rhodospirillales bacterium]
MADALGFKKTADNRSSFPSSDRLVPPEVPEPPAPPLIGFLAGLPGLRGTRRRRRRIVRMGGYVPASPRLYRLWNLALVVPLIVFCLPILLLISAVLAVAQGPRNVFYRGERVGKDFTTFSIFKFKTLYDAAAALTHDQVLPAGSRMETPVGKYLRDTRLDELPQLLNVLLGDMNLLGPRPVRPRIATACRERIPDYDVRFKVRPGLIGYTQALMPHGTDKVIRARINAVLCRRRVVLVQELMFILLTGISVIGWALRVPFRQVVGRLRGDGWKAAARPLLGEAVLGTAGHRPLRLRLVCVDDECLLVESPAPLPIRECDLTLSARGWLRPRGKAARCRAIPLASERRAAGVRGAPVYRYRMRYSPTSPLNRYLIDRYLLNRAVVF